MPATPRSPKQQEQREECIVKKKTSLKKIEFQVGAAAGSKVSVAGTFNNWDPDKNPMKDNPDSGHYKTVVALAPGRYEYKFVVNGEWRVDPNCSEWAPNSHGSLNSVLSVS
jgi:1,4-alpha-glucan branching enzyme